MQTNFNIEQYLDLSNYVTDERKSRRKNNKDGASTQEFFTPYEIVKRMCENIDDETLSDPTKTFLEPCLGSGQFILYILYLRLQHGIDWRISLKTCYGVELMADNIAECKQRVCDMLTQLCEDYNKEEAMKIMNEHFVCHDFFTWNFEEWRPMTEEEIKISKKKK